MSIKTNAKEHKFNIFNSNCREEKEESVLRVKMTGAEGKLRHINSLSLEAGRVCMDAHKVINLIHIFQFIIYEYICTHLFI